MKFREAVVEDAVSIAALHAASWRQSYWEMLSERFLNDEVVADRLCVWQARLANPQLGQWVWLAEDGNGLVGFVCLFSAADEQWGTLLDNLHVHANLQGQGVGRKLMTAVFEQQRKSQPDAGLFLWVFAQNTGAIRFYERLGGVVVGEKLETSFGETAVRALRIAWSTPIGE